MASPGKGVDWKGAIPCLVTNTLSNILFFTY
jgi:hypothetical protein